MIKPENGIKTITNKVSSELIINIAVIVKIIDSGSLIKISMMDK